jgi:hypothetical protein
LGIALLVSWPQFRPIHAQMVWWIDSDADHLRRREADELGTGSAIATDRTDPDAVLKQVLGAALPAAAAPPAVAAAPTLQRDCGPNATRLSAAGARDNALFVQAETSLSRPIPFANLAVRDARTGAVHARHAADIDGRFVFADLATGSYIVELADPAGRILATSDLLPLSRCLTETTLRVPLSSAVVRASLGNNLSPTLGQAVTLANASDVTRTTAALSPQVSSR